MRARSIAYCLALATFLPANSWASAVVEISGTGVTAVTPAGRARVATGSVVESRTRLVVARGPANRETVLRYEDGCEVRLRPGQVYTVLDEPPCAPAQPPVETTAPGSIIGTPAIVGVIAAGALAGGIIAATSGKGSNGSLPIYISP